MKDKIIDNIRNNLSILRDLKELTQTDFKEILQNIDDRIKSYKVNEDKSYIKTLRKLNQKEETKTDFSDFER